MLEKQEGKEKMKKGKGLKCVCGKTAEYKKGIHFGKYKLDGWECRYCREVYFDPEQAQRILILNKLKNKSFKMKVNKVRSNQIIRLPKEISLILNNPKEINLRLINEKEAILSIS